MLHATFSERGGRKVIGMRCISPKASVRAGDIDGSSVQKVSCTREKVARGYKFIGDLDSISTADAESHDYRRQCFLPPLPHKLGNLGGKKVAPA